MQIGELAQQTGASIRSLRYYEAMSLLPAKRHANGYRYFDASAVQQVQQIRTLLTTGFSIEDIRLLLPCLNQQEAGTPLCSVALDRYHQKLALLNEHIQTLQAIRQRVEERIQDALQPSRE